MGQDDKVKCKRSSIIFFNINFNNSFLTQFIPVLSLSVFPGGIKHCTEMGSVMYSEIDLLYVNSHRTPKLHNSFPFFIQCRGILAPRVMPKLFKSSRETRVKAPLHWLMFNPLKLFTTSSSQIFYPIVRSSSTRYYSNVYKNHVQSILRKIKKSSKVTQNWKKMILFLRVFWAPLPKIYFSRGDWALGCVPM